MAALVQPGDETAAAAPAALAVAGAMGPSRASRKAKKSERITRLLGCAALIEQQVVSQDDSCRAAGRRSVERYVRRLRCGCGGDCTAAGRVAAAVLRQAVRLLAARRGPAVDCSRRGIQQPLLQL
jgi:hypothetical protein